SAAEAAACDPGAAPPATVSATSPATPQARPGRETSAQETVGCPPRLAAQSSKLEASRNVRVRRRVSQRAPVRVEPGFRGPGTRIPSPGKPTSLEQKARLMSQACWPDGTIARFEREGL